MPWETFRRTSRPSPKEPTITLAKSGIIGLNTAVVRLLGDRRFALLMFEKEKGHMGIKILKKNEPDAYQVGVIPQKSHGSISGTAFMRTYGIEPPHTKAFPAIYDEKNETLIADVSDFVKEKKKGKM